MAVLRTIAALAISAVFLVAGCTASSGSSALPATAGALVIGSASTAGLGAFLTGADGKTLYTYGGDSPGNSTCTGDCATAWPPLTLAAGGQPTAGAGVTGELGTVARADGTTQVTYLGLPLYYWQGDGKAGDVTGDGVNGFSVAKVGGTVAAPSADPTKPGY